MNPPIRSLEHQTGLWKGISNGTVDVIGSDHAPHTIEEKKNNGLIHHQVCQECKLLFQ